MKFKTRLKVPRLNHIISCTSFIFLLYTSSCSSLSKKKVIIQGEIIGQEISEVIYSKPMNGVCYLGFSDTTQVDSLGKFRIEVNTDRANFIKLVINKRNIDLIIEPGDKINLSYDLTNTTNPLKIQGVNRDGQILLNKLPNPPSLSVSGLTKFLDNLNIEALKNEISFKLNNEASTIDSLYKEGNITSDFRELILIDRECYYQGLKASHAQHQFMKMARKDISLFSEDMKTLWNEIYIQSPITHPRMYYTRWWQDYTTIFLHKKEYLAQDFSVKKLIEIHKSGTIHTHNLEIAEKYLHNEFLELYTSIYLKNATFQKKYELELVGLFSNFTLKFPKSNYSKYISKQIQSINDFHKRVEENSEIEFIPNYNNINSLQECIEQFNGQPVFIDIWASWCAPCKDEFEYNEQLLKLLEKTDYKVLYISIDDDRRDHVWKRMIKGYNLKGKHIRANKNLNADLRKLYNKNNSLEIPWYIIVNEKGRIRFNHASKPSDLIQLETELISAKSTK